MRITSYRALGGIAAAAALACPLAAPSASAAPPAQVGPYAASSGPDRAHRTPVAQGAATARTAVSSSRLAGGLRRALRGMGKGTSAFVMDAETNRVLFRRSAGKRRVIASNMKLFTTATALARFGPSARLETSVWAGDDPADGITTGLFLRGQGDPTLTSNGLTSLAGRVRAAGVAGAPGSLFYDDFFFDQRTTVPQKGIRRESVGILSPLVLDGGRTRDPARTAAQRLADALRGAGVPIGGNVSRRQTPPESAGAKRIAAITSPTIAELARATNVPSNNYLAEMLLKSVGGGFGTGSTAGGIAVVQRFVAEHGARVKGQNGSGLSRKDRASAASTARLLDGMIEVDEGETPERQQEQTRLRDAFVNSLAVAGRSGTLARRMRGTAAARRCYAKTGTLNNVSALSGYCFRGPRSEENAVVFSLLMNGVNTDRARRAQDRSAALIARYSG
jgi:D-alanyl-D-alanine carboxypeptidase/D-alanyl-D-alanine-endopeptidase (penicillin-binding protein 4)